MGTTVVDSNILELVVVALVLLERCCVALLITVVALVVVSKELFVWLLSFSVSFLLLLPVGGRCNGGALAA